MKPVFDGRRLWAALALLAVGSLRAAEVPAPTPAERAEAFPALAHHSGHLHMDDNPVVAKLQFDELEWQKDSGASQLRWDGEAWIGNDDHRLLLRAEGRSSSGDTTSNRLELLWQRPVAAWWDLVAGIRNDNGTGPARTYGALGVQGTAPGQVHVEATVYAGEGGQTALNAKAELDLLLTNRLILTPRVEADAWGRDDEDIGVGSGFAEMSAGLRLRYEIRRELAPYVGFEWEGLFGDTADLARDAGDHVRERWWVAGLRFWF